MSTPGKPIDGTSALRVADLRRALPGDAGGTPGISSLEERPSLREEAADALRAALVAGQMRPGVVYSVPALATQFGVSATPVREAMLDLVKESLVEPVRNRGFRVTELSDSELDDITHLRALIEVPTVADIATFADAADVEALRPYAEAIVTSAQAGDLIGYIHSDRIFHLRLLGFAGNEQLVEIVRDLRDRARLYGLERMVEQGRLVASAEEHHELLEALLAHDSDLAEDVMARHIGHIRGIWSDNPKPENTRYARES
jgi:DNA-binding GntR family transcriptional regulator